MATKYIFVTGGVVSSLGKGVAAASVGAVLELKSNNPPTPKNEAYKKNVAALSKELAAAEKALLALGGKPEKPKPKGNGESINPDLLPGIVLDDSKAKLTGKWTKSVHTKPFLYAGYRHDQGQPKGKKEDVDEEVVDNGADRHHLEDLKGAWQLPVPKCPVLETDFQQICFHSWEDLFVKEDLW